MIPEVNIISEKARATSVNGAWKSGGASESLSGDFSGKILLRKFLGIKDHLNQHETDLNVPKIVTAQDYKSTKH